MLGTVCEACGHISYRHLLLCCRDCEGSPTHQYCMDTVIYDASSTDWLCYECQPNLVEVACSGGSIEKVPSEKAPGHAHFGSTVHQPITKGLKSARDAAPWRYRKSKSYVQKFVSLEEVYSSKKNSLPENCTKKESTVRPMGKCTNRKGRNATSVVRTSAKALHPCEIVGTEAAKSNNGKKRQVDNEDYVHTLKNVKQPSPVIVNSLGFKLGGIDLSKARKGRKSKKAPKSVTTPLKGLVVKDKNAVLGSKKLESPCPTTERGKSVLEESGDKSNCMKDSGANSSSELTNHDNQTNQHALVGCKDTIVYSRTHRRTAGKNTEVNCVKDNRTVVGAHQNKYRAAELLRNSKDKSQVRGDCNSNPRDGLTLIRETEEDIFQQDYRASNELQQRSIAANVPQPSTMQNDVLDKTMPYTSNMGMFPKENSILPSEHVEIENPKEYQSEPSKLLDQENFILADSATEEEISDAVQNFGKDNPRKQRQLALLYDDDDDDDNKEEKAENVQPENVNPRSLNYDVPMVKHRIDSEYYAEEALNDPNLNNGRPVKKRRRYTDANKDEDGRAIVGVMNADFALNDVANCALNDGANLASETVVAIDHALQSRTISNSEHVGQQHYICSQPVNEPVWSGVFKIKGEVSVKVDAHLSNNACQKVWEFSRSLQPVVEVMKFPRWQAWPKRWKSSGPTDGCIGLYFFPDSLRPNEVSNRLVNEIIKSDDALKVTVGIAKLLIFPSTLLPEQNHLYKGKHYLWGVFKRRKHLSDKGVLAIEQDGSAYAAEEVELQEQHLLDQQDEVQRESSDQETSVVEHAENLPLVVAQMEAMKISTAEGITLPGSSLSHAKPNSPKAGSSSSVHPEEMNQQEDYFTSLPELNASSVAKLSAEHGHEQSRSGAEPPTTKLFSIVVARTPRVQQLIQEMASEGALAFPVHGETVTDDFTSTGNDAGGGSGLNPVADHQLLRELPQPFDFISTGLGEPPQPDMASQACLELFPVRQEQIAWAAGVDASSMGVDLDLSLAVPSRPPSAFQR